MKPDTPTPCPKPICEDTFGHPVYILKEVFSYVNRLCLDAKSSLDLLGKPKSPNDALKIQELNGNIAAGTLLGRQLSIMGAFGATEVTTRKPISENLRQISLHQPKTGAHERSLETV